MKYFDIESGLDSGNTTISILRQKVERGSATEEQILAFADWLLDASQLKSERELLDAALFLNASEEWLGSERITAAFVAMIPIFEVAPVCYVDALHRQLMALNDYSFITMAYQYFYIPPEHVGTKIFEEARRECIKPEMLDLIGMSLGMSAPDKIVLAKLGDCTLEDVSRYLNETTCKASQVEWYRMRLEYQLFFAECKENGVNMMESF